MADVKEPEVSKSGIWVDSKTGKIVKSQPEEGVQICPPGGEVTAEVRATVDRYENVDTAVEPAVETATVSKPKK